MIDHGDWKYRLALLGLYGFLIELKPSEAYLNPYLVHDKGFSNSQLNNSIYPFSTYGQLLFILLVPATSQLITPKRMFYIESCGFLFTRWILIRGTSLWSMQAMQLTYAVGKSVKAVYLCYMYLLVEKCHYHQATGFVWGAQALGMSMAGLIGQVLFSYCHWSLLALNYFSMVSVCCAFVVSVFIPSQQQSQQLQQQQPLEHKEQSQDEITLLSTELSQKSSTNTEDDEGQDVQCYQAVSPVSIEQPCQVNNKQPEAAEGCCWAKIWAEYRTVLELFRDHRGPWATTWILARCCEELMQNYAQVLWTQRAINNNHHSSSSYSLYGTICAAYMGAGVAASLLPVYYNLKQQQQRTWMIQTVSVVGLCTTMILMTWIERLSVAYVTYVLYGACYYAFMTCTSCQLASHSSVKEQVLLYAANLFCASALATMVTAVLSSMNATTQTWFWTITALQLVLLPLFLLSSSTSR
ncbi:Thiamine transporter 1 [Seminavis robusta]|uniref:Thiamine transporter 1 n=1 Tax=Seminavis robusta TaxID=568900 RepID=A0A9N8DYP9_9STRA|nr:Thiamine transporter 1 [Seminavis robusta]|eukprot:Sro472_g149850.1 Thiamine transporter 1 (467) ;mRNA; f:6978-8378